MPSYISIKIQPQTLPLETCKGSRQWQSTEIIVGHLVPFPLLWSQTPERPLHNEHENNIARSWCKCAATWKKTRRLCSYFVTKDHFIHREYSVQPTLNESTAIWMRNLGAISDQKCTKQQQGVILYGYWLPKERYTENLRACSLSLSVYRVKLVRTCELYKNKWQSSAAECAIVANELHSCPAFLNLKNAWPCTSHFGTHVSCIKRTDDRLVTQSGATGLLGVLSSVYFKSTYSVRQSNEEN